MQQQLHMPPASMEQRFCRVLQASLSSQAQVIFIPPVQRSTRKVQRGTIIQFTPVGTVPGVPMAVAPIPAVFIPGIPVRSIIIAVDIYKLLSTLKRTFPANRMVEASRSNGIIGVFNGRG